MFWHIVLALEVNMNDSDSYVYILAALLPLSACMLVFQVNPYHALVLRGVLGAIAALVYAILGAADVALTEALMGTLLAISLYAITVRSSLVLRLGALEEGVAPEDFQQVIDNLRAVFRKRHMRLELVPYTNTQALQRALIEKEVHATCTHPDQLKQYFAASGVKAQPYHIATRVRRIYDIIQTELSSPETTLTYVNTPDVEEKH
jgi:putative multicomponent Na+:H+ antiporter subunit B